MHDLRKSDRHGRRLPASPAATAWISAALVLIVAAGAAEAQAQAQAQAQDEPQPRAQAQAQAQAQPQDQPQPRARTQSSPSAQQRPARIGDKPNLNGIWTAVGAPNWNLEPHNASGLDEFWQLGAIAAVPPSLGVVEGGEIPYLPEARKQRDANRAAWPAGDPEANCYLPGIPRASYMPYPFQIVQSEGDDLFFVYEYASANRPVFMKEHREPPIDTWMGTSNGSWDGDTLVVETTGLNGKTWLDRAGNFAGAGAKVTERFALLDDSHMQYEATIENAHVFSRPWKIRLVLYREVEPNAELLEFRCVPFSEKRLYKDVLPSSGGK